MVAGFSRGFASFGTAMIYVPLVALAYDTKTAVITLFLVDVLPSVPLVWKAAPHCDRPTMIWMAIGAAIMSPIGVAALLFTDQEVSRLILGVLLLLIVSHMLLQQQFRVASSPRNSLLAGAAAGFAGGLYGMLGPPAVAYLLGRHNGADKTRSDIIVFVTGASLMLGVTYLIYGMYSASHLKLSALLMPIYGASMWAGTQLVLKFSESLYRRILLALLWAMSALIVANSTAKLLT